jgi:nucleoside phosphorylase
VSADRDLIIGEVERLKTEYGAIAGDWESGAIAWVAARNRTRCLILRAVSDDCLLADWDSANLRVPTAFRTSLVTLPTQDIVAKIGRLSDRDWTAAQKCLRLSIAV